MNKTFFIIIALIILLYVTQIVRHNKLPIKESFWWLIGSVAILILAIFPQILNWVAELVGIAYPPSLLLVICSIFLLFINFRDSRRIAKLQTQNIELEQQIALIKNKLQNPDQKGTNDKNKG